MKKTLVVMAAGMGSRFGGFKQIEPVGPSGEYIIDYSIYDAIKAGFNKIIFVIKEEHLDVFKAAIGKRIGSNIEVIYAFQKQDDLPIPCDTSTRTKPLGTGHAVYAARNYVDENFAVINADDFYGYSALKQMADFLDNNLVDTKEHYAIIGYKLINTLSENGAVNRGVCIQNDKGLRALQECSVIEENGILYKTPIDTTDKQETDPNTLVSMNLFGFPKEFMTHVEEELILYIKENKNDMSKGEFSLPKTVTKQIRNGNAEVKVLETDETWYGVTYKEDKDVIVNAINRMIESGIYSKNLWEKE